MAKPSEKDILNILKQHRSPAECYNEVRKRFGKGFGLFTKEVALKHKLWKRKNVGKSASSAHPSALPSALSSTQVSAYNETDASAIDSASAYPQNIMHQEVAATSDPMAEPLPVRMKNFKSMLEIMAKSGYAFDPALVALSMGYRDIATSVKGSNLSALMDPQLQNPNQTGRAQQNESGARPTMLGNLGQTIRSVIDSILEVKVIVPLVSQLLTDGNLGNGKILDKNEIQRMMEEQLKKVQGDPEVKALKEMIAKQQEEQRFKELVEKSGGSKSGNEELLKFQIEQLKQQQKEKSETDNTRYLVGNATELATKLQQMQLDFQSRLDNERRSHEAQVESMRKDERQQYVERLKSLEEKASASGNTLEQYVALRSLVKDELNDLDRLRENRGRENNVPELVMSAVKELAPVAMKFTEMRGPQPPVTAAARATPAAQVADVGPSGTITGQCQWCGNTITVADANEVQCPKCGKTLYPHGPPAATAPVGPNAPVGPPPAVQEYTLPNGEVAQRRDPNSPVML
jgi:ribosomal protein S27E